MGVPGATTLRAWDRCVSHVCVARFLRERRDRYIIEAVLKGRREKETEMTYGKEVYRHQGLLHALTHIHTNAQRHACTHA